MPGTRHFYFLDSIGQGDWFSYGTTLQDVRYAVEGYSFFDGEPCPDSALPEAVVFHYPKCYGGDVWEGYGIYNYKRSLAARGVKTTSIVEGLCASIATLTALGSDTVLMADAAFWMVHKPMVDTGEYANADEHVAAAVVLNKIQDQVASRYVARSGGKLDLAGAHALMNQTSWLTADECLAYGFITGKLEEAPLEAPVGAEKVLNSLSKSALKPANMATLTAAEKKTFFAELKEDFKNFFKNEVAAPAPAPAPDPAPVNVQAYAVDVDGGDPMYVDIADDGVEDIDASDPVYSDAALTTAYPDGDYTLADGRAVTVTGGIVATIADAAEDTATTEAANAATNAAPDEALVAENSELKAANALLQRKLNAATNKLAKAVPGSTGNPTPAGTQNVAGKTAAPKNAAGAMFSLTPPSTSTRK